MRDPKLWIIAGATVTALLALYILSSIAFQVFVAIRDAFAIVSQREYYPVLPNLLLGTPGRFAAVVLCYTLFGLAISLFARAAHPAPIVLLVVLGIFLIIFGSFDTSVQNATDYPNAMVPINGDYATVAAAYLMSFHAAVTGRTVVLFGMLYDNRQWLFDGAGPAAIGYFFGRRARK